MPSIACFITCMQWNPHIHLWCNTYWPLGGKHGSCAVLIHKLVNKYWWSLSLASIVSLPQSVRQDRRSTDWAMSARQKPFCISFSLHWWIQAFIGNKFLSGDLCVIMGNTTIGVSQLFSPLTCCQAFEAFFLSIVPRVFFWQNHFISCKIVQTLAVIVFYTIKIYTCKYLCWSVSVVFPFLNYQLCY